MVWYAETSAHSRFSSPGDILFPPRLWFLFWLSLVTCPSFLFAAPRFRSLAAGRLEFVFMHVLKKKKTSQARPRLEERPLFHGSSCSLSGEFMSLYWFPVMVSDGVSTVYISTAQGGTHDPLFTPSHQSKAKKKKTKLISLFYSKKKQNQTPPKMRHGWNQMVAYEIICRSVDVHGTGIRRGSPLTVRTPLPPAHVQSMSEEEGRIKMRKKRLTRMDAYGCKQACGSCILGM